MRILFLYLTEANPILPKQYAKSIVYQDRPDITLLYFFQSQIGSPASPDSLGARNPGHRYGSFQISFLNTAADFCPIHSFYIPFLPVLER